jgi:hypothetical protein
MGRRRRNSTLTGLRRYFASLTHIVVAHRRQALRKARLALQRLLRAR